MTAQPDATSTPPVDAATLRAARRFLALVAERHPASDADMAVVLRGAKGDRGAVVIDMAGVAFDVMMD